MKGAIQKIFSYNNLYLAFFLLLLVLVGFYSIITIPVGSDNGNVYFEVQHFKNNGFDRAYKTLTPVIPVVLYSILEEYNIPVLILSCISTILFLISIYLLIKLFFGYKYPIFLIFLFPIIFERSLYLAPYPLFMFLFTVSLYFFVKATQIKKETSVTVTHEYQEQEGHNEFSRQKFYILSALFLSLSIYTFTLALILCVVPFFYLIFTKLDRNSKFRIFIKYYFCLFLFLFPWLYWHFKIGGLKYFYYSPLNWYTIKALPLVNKYFWGYGSIAYSDLLRLYSNQLIPNILLSICLIFIVFGLLNYKKFKIPIKFSILWIIFYLPFVAIFGASSFSRYFFPLVVPLMLISSAGLIALKKYNKKALYFALSLILIYSILYINTSYFSSWRIENFFQPSTSLLDFKGFKELINNDKNIFSRHHAFQYLFNNNFFITQSDMAEEDALKLISWSSDSDVKEILKKYNIGWIILYNDEKKWEHDYYCWVSILYDKEPIHYKRVKNSNLFEEIKHGKQYSLYKFVDSE